MDSHGLTSEQERFFSHSSKAKPLTPFSVFYSVLAAILAAWVIIGLITAISLTFALHHYEKSSADLFKEMSAHARQEIEQRERQYVRQQAAPEPKHGPKIIHVDQP